MEKELPEACKICIENKNVFRNGPMWKYGTAKIELFVSCGNGECLPKDRTMIVLLNKILNK